MLFEIRIPLTIICNEKRLWTLKQLYTIAWQIGIFISKNNSLLYRNAFEQIKQIAIAKWENNAVIIVVEKKTRKISERLSYYVYLLESQSENHLNVSKDVAHAFPLTHGSDSVLLRL